MSEDVNIVSIGAGIPEWATEKTLSDIFSILKNNSKTSKKQERELKKDLKSLVSQGKRNPSDMKALFKKLSDHYKATKQNTASQQQANSSQNKNKAKNVKPAKASVFSSLSPKGSALTSPMHMITNALLKTFGVLGKTVAKIIVGAMSGIVKSIGKILTRVSTLVLGLVSMAIGKIFTSITEQIELYRNLSNSGIALNHTLANTGNGMENFAQSITMANLSAKQLANLSKDYARVMMRYGIKQFAATARSFEDVGHRFGLLSSESAKFLASYLNQQAMIGVIDRMSRHDALVAAQRQLEVTDAFSRALLVSKEALEEERQKLLSADSARAALFALPEDIRQRAQDILGNIGAAATKSMGQGGEELVNMLTEGIGKGAEWMRRTDLFRSLQVMNGNLAEYMTQFVENVRAGKDVDPAAALERMVKAGQLSTEGFERLNMIVSSGQLAGAEAARGVFIGLKDLKMQINAAGKVQAHEAEQIVKAYVKVKDMWNLLVNAFDKVVAGIFGNAQSAKRIENALKEVASFIDKNKEKIYVAIASFVEFSVKALKQFMNWLDKFIVNVNGTEEFDFKAMFTEMGKNIAVAIAEGIVLVIKETIKAIIPNLSDIVKESLKLSPAGLAFGGISSYFSDDKEEKKPVAGNENTPTTPAIEKSLNSLNKMIDSRTKSEPTFDKDNTTPIQQPRIQQKTDKQPGSLLRIPGPKVPVGNNEVKDIKIETKPKDTTEDLTQNQKDFTQSGIVKDASGQIDRTNLSSINNNKDIISLLAQIAESSAMSSEFIRKLYRDGRDTA